MTKLYSLFAGTTTDTEVKAVAENQIIQMEGHSYDRYVVHQITHDRYGYRPIRIHQEFRYVQGLHRRELIKNRRRQKNLLYLCQAKPHNVVFLHFRLCMKGRKRW